LPTIGKIFVQQTKLKAEYTLVLDKMLRQLDEMNLDRQHGLRTGNVYFRVGVQNTGTADALISPGAQLESGQSRLPLVPEGDRNAYTIIPAGRISEIMLIVDETNSADGPLESWKASVMEEEQEDFEVTLEEGDKQLSIEGRLPITEDVAEDVWPWQQFRAFEVKR
jgi:hypothetical protein